MIRLLEVVFEETVSGSERPLYTPVKKQGLAECQKNSVKAELIEALPGLFQAQVGLPRWFGNL